MPINSKQRIREIQSNRAAKEKEQLRAQVRANTTSTKPRAGLIREALMKKRINTTVRTFLTQRGFGEVKIQRVTAIALELYKIQKRMEKLDSYIGRADELRKIQPTPKLQPKYDEAKRNEFNLFFKYLDGTRSTKDASKKASEKSGLGKLEEKRRAEIKRLFEESSHTYKNAPPRTLRRAKLDLWELAFKATDYTFRESLKLRGELDKELNSIKLGTQLMNEIEKISGFTEWESRPQKL